jgi:hypothetical protein
MVLKDDGDLVRDAIAIKRDIERERETKDVAWRRR